MRQQGGPFAGALTGRDQGGRKERIAGRFARYEPRLRAGRLVLDLLSDLPRKDCWTIAEWSGG
ncbi:hypothetical protein FCH28_06770 [Streptomyces piniterrae]|uniref:Uncharacterized protein n=1 Tax=Streptomyces piniterrae TaxID=2571125 RepID=A0A4U0NRN5_9ACTN|nr:hypothetical protein FCH28_06770 [Streptomyces piniterrae]